MGKEQAESLKTMMSKKDREQKIADIKKKLKDTTSVKDMIRYLAMIKKLHANQIAAVSAAQKEREKKTEIAKEKEKARQAKIAADEKAEKKTRAAMAKAKAEEKAALAKKEIAMKKTK